MDKVKRRVSATQKIVLLKDKDVPMQYKQELEDRATTDRNTIGNIYAFINDIKWNIMCV
jgi:hypothetical protein